jgi:hypothetical protein
MRTITFTCDTCNKNIPYYPEVGAPRRYIVEFSEVRLSKKDYPINVEIEMCEDCEDNVRKLMFNKNSSRDVEPMQVALKSFLVSIATKKP